MKKILFLILMFFVIGFPTFSDQQIGNRLILEMPGSSGFNYLRFVITDVYDDIWCGILIEHVINETFNISYNGWAGNGYINRNHKKLGAANLYSNDFSSTIVNNIRIISQTGGNVEWQNYAYSIANIIQDEVQIRHRGVNQQNRSLGSNNTQNNRNQTGGERIEESGYATVTSYLMDNTRVPFNESVPWGIKILSNNEKEIYFGMGSGATIHYNYNSRSMTLKNWEGTQILYTGKYSESGRTSNFKFFYMTTGKNVDITFRRN